MEVEDGKAVIAKHQWTLVGQLGSSGLVWRLLGLSQR